MKSNSRILLLEDSFLVVLPLFLILSLRKFVHPVFFYALAGILVILIGYGIRRRKNILALAANTLFVSSWAAFILGLWGIYDLGSLYLFPDTRVYMFLSKLSLSSSGFWAFGSRPFVTPLIFKIFRRNLGAVNDFYIAIYIISAAALFFVFSRFFETRREKLLAGYLTIFFFFNQHNMSLWLSSAMSEVPSLVSVLWIISAFGLAYAYGKPLQEKKILPFIALGGLLILSVLFAFSRDTNAYFLPVMAVFCAVIFKKRSHRVAALISLLLVFAAALGSAERAGRWRFPLGNVLFKRIIPDEEWRPLFQREYRLPGDEVVMPCAGLWFQQRCPGKPAVKAWIKEQGSSAYRDFLIKHPGYVLVEWVKGWKTQQESLWILERNPKYYADPRVRAKRLNDFLFYFPGFIPFPLAVLIGLLGIVFLRRNPLILFCLAYFCVVGIVSFHADAQEVTRHAQQAVMALKLAFLLAVLHLYVWLKTRLSSPYSRLGSAAS